MDIKLGMHLHRELLCTCLHKQLANVIATVGVGTTPSLEQTCYLLHLWREDHPWTGFNGQCHICFCPPGIKAESALVAVQRPNISRSITFQISYVCKYVRIRFLGRIREETLDEMDPLRLLCRIQRANLNSPPPIHPSVDCAGPELVC